MGAHLCEKLFAGVDYSQIAISVVAQYFLIFFWYAAIFGSLFRYYLAADKGVKRFEKMIMRWGMGLCTVSSLVAAAIKSFAIYALVNATNSTTLCQYQTIAGIIAFIVISMQHHNYWEQRPLALIIIAAGAEIATALLSATVQYYLKVNDIKIAF